jgi:hypothetical protein
MDKNEPARRPSLMLRVLEARAVAELYAYAWAYPWLHLAPRGDNHPVLVLPGFLATGSSTFPLRHILKRLGYKGHRWKLGRNLGPVRIQLEQVVARLHELRRRYDQRVTLIGWSLGGLYARELAWLAPDDVRMVITLGSPFRHHDSTHATWLYRSINASHGEKIERALLARVDKPLPVPSTSIYSRGDGVVPWQCSIDRPSPRSENVRVFGSHCGLGHNPAALWVILDRIAQREGTWQPFRPGSTGRFVYPTPDAFAG